MRKRILGLFLAAMVVVLSGCVGVETADIVVIGGGNAGLAAAVTAAEKGASVILIEKMSMLGGNTIRSGGAYNAVDPVRQPQQGIEDSVDKHFKQTIEGGDNKGNPELVKILVSRSLAGLDWLQSYGMKFNEKIGSVVGSLWPRTHQATDPAGTGYIKTLSAAAEKLGVKIYLNVRAEELVLDKQGRVAGVQAKDEKTGKKMGFEARRAVILATGGFAANVQMRMKYNPKLTADLGTTNHPGATGDGIVMAEKIGADLVGMEYIQLLPLANKQTGSVSGAVIINIDSAIFVNHEGKRFINEDGRRDDLSNAILRQTKGEYFWVNDSLNVGERNALGERIEDLVASGTVLKADTIEALAAKMGCDPAVFGKTVADFNASVDSKKDEFGRAVWANKIAKAPFYAVVRGPAVHHTMGGLKINTDARVLSKAGNPIPGLYAAGEVTGGIHGTNRLGGNALVDTIVFGRIAGANASAETAR